MPIIPSTQGNPQLTDIASQNAFPMIGTASRADANDVLTNVDAELSKLMEDRNFTLVDGGTLTYTTGSPSQLSMTASLKLIINSQVAGGTPTSIDLGSATRNFSANGRMLYAVINRSAGTATITADSATLPAVTSANQEVVLIAKRFDGATERVYLRNGQSLGNANSSTLGGFPTTYLDTTFAINDTTDQTKQIKFDATGTTATSTTIVTAQTANRTFTLPDASTTALGTDVTQVITNKDIDGGAAANTRRITLPKDTTTNINALTRKQGTLLYDTTTEQVKYDNGTTLTALAAGATATPTAQGSVTSYFPIIQSAVKIVSAANYTILTTDGYEEVQVTTSGANRTITLPAAASNTGRVLRITKVDSATGSVVVDGNASETINGALTFSMAIQYDSLTIYCDGTGWVIVNFYYDAKPIVYTPTFTGFTTSATTFWYRRVGTYMHVEGALTVSTVSGAMKISLPAFANMDNNFLTGFGGAGPSSTSEHVGLAEASVAGTQYQGRIFQDSSSLTTFGIYSTTGGGGTTSWSSTFPGTWVGSDTLRRWRIVVPIAEYKN